MLSSLDFCLIRGHLLSLAGTRHAPDCRPFDSTTVAGEVAGVESGGKYFQSQVSTDGWVGISRREFAIENLRDFYRRVDGFEMTFD